jgi:FkbM family methyltransferase
MKKKPFHQFFRVANYRRSLPIRVVAGAAEGFLRLYNNVNYDAVANGERRILSLLGTRDITCIFDVGASVGEWLQLARECCPTSTIHAFEIVPPSLEKLRLATASDGKAIINGVGLADESRQLEIHYCSEDPELSSAIAWGPASSTIVCQMTTGDAYCAERGVTHIDLLKLDVEGLELPALRGFRQMLSTGCIACVQFEYGLVNIVPKFLLKDLYECLAAFGYVIGKVFPTYIDFRPYELTDETFEGPNYLAVRKDLTTLIQLLA